MATSFRVETARSTLTFGSMDGGWQRVVFGSKRFSGISAFCAAKERSESVAIACALSGVSVAAAASWFELNASTAVFDRPTGRATIGRWLDSNHRKHVVRRKPGPGQSSTDRTLAGVVWRRQLAVRNVSWSVVLGSLDGRRNGR